MAVPVFKYRRLARVLRKGGARYLGQDGRNHHVWLYAPAGLGAVTVGIAAHSDGADVLPVYVKALRKAWKLRPEDGVSDRDFCKGNWRQESG